MPYIKDKEKHEISDTIDNLKMWILSKGDLNYAICELVGSLILDGEKISYTEISNWISGVHDAEVELNRRLLSHYENLKIIENGDVPSFVGIFKRIKEGY